MREQELISKLGRPAHEASRGKVRELQWPSLKLEVRLEDSKVDWFQGDEMSFDGDLLARAGDSGKSVKARLDNAPRFPKHVEKTEG